MPPPAIRLPCYHTPPIFAKVENENETWADIVQVASQNVDKSSLTLWPSCKVPELSSWSGSSGRVVVIGSATDAMAPTGGQGGAMAFEDALTSADTLALIDNKKEEEPSVNNPPREETLLQVQQWQSDRYTCRRWKSHQLRLFAPPTPFDQTAPPRHRPGHKRRCRPGCNQSSACKCLVSWTTIIR
ncbi:hypothetical protein AYL99_11737 [Fonsecaea erecta]|uniref:Uncharacterized protein n=1 Tax=Fonsecaea erecta TaxID=1367422 RepID=A0A178Z347_9EURO|nr:hypothetical protein AYL99_11737 [Fonsecaea erecta]OAP54202.1 hypothetical protein AYL99_11737 [Fonsecaea erecta]